MDSWLSSCGFIEQQRPTEADLETLRWEPLAFSETDDNQKYVEATSRLPFYTADQSALLNVECFFFDDDGTLDAPVLLFVHGICASSETRGVQSLVRHAQSVRGRVAVLELEGHGLSSGPRGVCGDFSRLVGHVVEFVHHVMTEVVAQDKIATRGASSCDSTPFVLCGSSLGGALTAYAADRLAGATTPPSVGRFLGAALIAPAVGVDERAVPGALTVAGLRMLARVAPTAKLSLTPSEDPDSYAAPADSVRNFRGHWPLATSRMLLDLTSTQALSDVQDGTLSFDRLGSLVVFSGDRDEVVPFQRVQEFYDLVRLQQDQKALIKVPRAGHDLMYVPAFSTEIVRQLFQWMDSLPSS